MIRRKERPPAPELQHPCGLDLGGRDNVRLRLEGSTKEAMETGKTRLLVAFAVFALAFAVVGLRLVDLALLSEAKEPQRIAGAVSAPVALPRADIVDRNGEILATTLPSASIYADPGKIIDPEGTARALASVLPEESAAELAAKLSSDRGFIWIKRNVSPREQQLVNDLGLPGVDFIRFTRMASWSPTSSVSPTSTTAAWRALSCPWMSCCVARRSPCSCPWTCGFSTSLPSSFSGP